MSQNNLTAHLERKTFKNSGLPMQITTPSKKKINTQILEKVSKNK